MSLLSSEQEALYRSNDEDPLHSSNLHPPRSASSSKTMSYKTLAFHACLVGVGILLGSILNLFHEESAPETSSSSSMAADPSNLLPMGGFYEADGIAEILVQPTASSIKQSWVDQDLNPPPIEDMDLEQNEMLTVLLEEQDTDLFFFINETYQQQEEILCVEDETSIPTFMDLMEPEKLDDETNVTSLQYERKLGNCNLHGALACNANLDTTPCSNFSSLLDVMADPGDKLVIPCGECYEVDITDGSELDLPGGILLEGKLYFPSTASVSIRTKFVWVVGLLKMDTPSLDSQVKFTMYGDELQVYENSVRNETCGVDSEGGSCNVGSKVIAVMGGRLEIAGMEENCPAWEKLTGVGEGTLRPFAPPCEGGACWQSDVIELAGSCTHSQGHSDSIGKYTVHCPIKSTGVHIGGGTSTGIKLTGMGPLPFEYPVATDGKTLSLTLNGGCSRAGHSDSFNKCTVYCPLKSSAVIPGGFGGKLTFTSIKSPEIPYTMPSDSTGKQVNLKIASTCGESAGHTDAWGRCVIRCKVDPTANVGSGSSWQKLELTSRYVDPPPFNYPTDDTTGQVLSLVKRGNAAVSWGHTNAWGACVVTVPIMSQFHVPYGIGQKLTFSNAQTDNSYSPTRIMHWAWGGSTMYTFADDYATTDCQQAADAWNAAFDTGDSMDVSYPIEQGYGGNTFAIDRVMHWAHASSWFYFFPSDRDTATCGATAEDFKSKFKVGYNIDVGHPKGPEGGQEFQVNGVHHWAWNGKGMYFFPEASDPSSAACSATASQFSSMFPANYGIDVSYHATAEPGEVVTASKGIHHWSWSQGGLYFFPDETDAEINTKFPPGFQVKVEYLDTFDYTEVQVSPEAADCWKPGTEVLLTSHTHSQNDQQVRTIVSTDPTTGNIVLDQPIDKPLSLQDSADFSVEIASLNRRIVFDAESDTNDDRIGGHLIVHHTSTPQHIEGVEIRNFGQQGRLGRYPLHFHMCDDSPESLVKKNVVRNSNQRGYVVHLTNQVTLEQNVAFDITGHCYFIEDGAETGNTFRGNLGTGIKNMDSDRVAQLSASSGRTETDGNNGGFAHGFNGASVFWISNPDNYFYGNIAGGGAKNGFWFETNGPRLHKSLGAFEDNEVHSQGAFAFTVYSPGWRPYETATIKNLKAYRNGSWGAFLHATFNVNFDGGLFADNAEKDVMISRGDNHVFDGTTFIGKSEFAPSRYCGGRVGIHLDPVRMVETVLGAHSGDYKGTTIRNASFQNYDDIGCSQFSMPLKFFSHQTFVKAFNAPHYIENVQFDVPSQIDACMTGTGIDDLSVEIVSDNNAALTPNGTAGFLVSPKLTPMVSTGCQAYNECLEFCEGACLRSVTVVAGNAAFGDDLVLVVKRVSDGTTLAIEKEVRGHPVGVEANNRYDSAYTVALAKDNYVFSFESLASPGVKAWPKYSKPVFEAAPSCTNHLVESDIQLVKPANPARPECDQLIYNGNFDSGSWSAEGWFPYYGAGFDFSETGGVDGSGALNAPVSPSHPAQSLDGSCIQAGDQFEISFDFKIEAAGDSSSLPIPVIASPGNNRYFQPLDQSVYVHGSWNNVKDIWTVTEDDATKDKFKFFLGNGIQDQMMLIDNVSITKISRRKLRA